MFIPLIWNVQKSFNPCRIFHHRFSKVRLWPTCYPPIPPKKDTAQPLNTFCTSLVGNGVIAREAVGKWWTYPFHGAAVPLPRFPYEITHQMGHGQRAVPAAMLWQSFAVNRSDRLPSRLAILSYNGASYVYKLSKHEFTPNECENILTNLVGISPHQSCVVFPSVSTTELLSNR